MLNQPTTQPNTPETENRRHRAQALARRARVFVAAGAMVAASFAVAAPAGAPALGGAGSDVQVTATAAVPSGSTAQTATPDAVGPASSAAMRYASEIRCPKGCKGVN